MRRVGLPDIVAALMVAIIIVMPPREPRVGQAYRDLVRQKDPAPEKLAEIARVQSEMAQAPERADLSDRLAELMNDVGQTDDALRIATAALDRGAKPRWQAELTVASVYSDRIELENARGWAKRALHTCRETSCSAEQQVRMQIFADELDKAVAALKDGIDPRLEPVRFRERVRGDRLPIHVGH